MQKVAAAIRLGAKTFINYEYKVLLWVLLIVALALTWLVSWYTAVAMLIGALMSALAGWIGMKMATYANVRMTERARTSKNLGQTLRVAFRGGSVMGLAVGGFALLGIVIIYVVFGLALKQLSLESLRYQYTNWLGVTFTPFTMTLSGFALGCSLIAMFNRVGGGIYTKAADMGADLVGKTELHIPEDDPRNPAVIADNVGDNVGDVAGLGSDLLESYVGSIMSAIILACHLYLVSVQTGQIANEQLLMQMIKFPLVLAVIGLIACGASIYWFLKQDLSKIKDPHKTLNGSTWLAAGLTLVGGFLAAWIMFGKLEVTNVGFRFGFVSVWLGTAIGVIAGVIIGIFAEYYTSEKWRPTRKVAQASAEGPALTITSGLALGMRSCMLPCIVLGLSIIAAYYCAGVYGVAMSAVGMLSFVGATVTVDTYGPISDNAGGIAEMTGLSEEVRQITDTLDAVGNTTAAIGKGFAIGSGALAALSLMISYLYSYNNPATPLVLNLIEPLTLAGVIIGGALPFIFSGTLIEAVAKAAQKMVDEVRRQFREIMGLAEGKTDPNYKTCIEIATKGALTEMKAPALQAIIVPIVAGFLFGPEFVGGIIIGATVCAIMIAIFAGNAGGAWDNAKKMIEAGKLGEGKRKGSLTHEAAVVGDTVGDPLKDTVGPCLDIFIKIMATVSLVTVSIFAKYNLLDWLKSLF